MTDEPAVLGRHVLTRASLRHAALRAALHAAALAGLTLALWRAGGTAASGPLVVWGALVGVLAGPVAVAERALRPRSEASHLAGAALVWALAVVLSSEAWTQARYTAAVLDRGSVDAGLQVVAAGAGVISRRPAVATLLLVLPATALALDLLLQLRDQPARARLAVGALTGALLAVAPTAWSHGPGAVEAGLVALGVGIGLAAPTAALGADRVDDWLVRRGTDTLPA